MNWFRRLLAFFGDAEEARIEERRRIVSLIRGMSANLGNVKRRDSDGVVVEVPEGYVDVSDAGQIDGVIADLHRQAQAAMFAGVADLIESGGNVLSLTKNIKSPDLVVYRVPRPEWFR